MVLARVPRDGAQPARAALAGAAAALGLAPWNCWWLALPALALLIAQIAGTGAGGWRLFRLGWVAGAGYFLVALFWIVEPFLIDVARHGWMAPFALVLMAGGMALFWGVAGLVAGLAAGRAGRALGFALGLAATDLLRGYVFTGFPWAQVGQIYVETPILQAAALAGPGGLSLLALLPAALPSLSRSPAARAALAALAVVVLGLVWIWGQGRLDAPVPPRAPPFTVRLVQPDADQHLKWRADMWRVFFDRQMALSQQPAPVPLDLIVWPETAVPFLLEDAGPFFEDLALSTGGVPLALGIQRRDGARYYNSLALTDARGALIATYDKWHLVPFGEYVPFGDALGSLGFTAFAAQAGNGYSSGPAPRVLDSARSGRILPLICYEAVFAQDLFVPGARPDWILQITNDGWFGTVSGPYQHLAQARMRAVEQGLPLLRAANTGVSAVVDARGQVLQELPLGAIGVIDAAVPPPLPATLYSRTGDSVVALALIAALGALLAARRSRAG